MSSPRQKADPPTLPAADLGMAAVIVPGALAVSAGIAGMFVAHLVVSLGARVPWPASHFVDATTIVTGALFAALFLICLRAHLRVRKRASQGEQLVLVARAVPWVMAIAFVAGVVFGARTAKASERQEEDAARRLCAQVGESAPADDRCLVAAIRCGRGEGRKVTLEGSADEACVREALSGKK